MFAVIEVVIIIAIWHWLFDGSKSNGSKYCYISLTIQSNISQLFTQLNEQTILFITIQFNKSFVFSQFTCQTFFGPIDITISGAASPILREPGSKGNKGLLSITQSSSITCTSPDSLVSYSGHSLEVLTLWPDDIGEFFSHSWLNLRKFWIKKDKTKKKTKRISQYTIYLRNNWYIKIMYWLNLTACQPVYGYFMPKG